MAVLSYKFYLKKYSARIIFSIFVFANCLVASLYLILFYRINKKLGIPDIVLIMIADSFNSFVMKLLIIPILSVGCCLSSKNIEASMIGSFYCAMNLGSFLGDVLSSIISNIFKLENSRFDNLYLFIITCKCFSILPVIVLNLLDDVYFNPTESIIKETNCEKIEWSNEKLLFPLVGNDKNL